MLGSQNIIAFIPTLDPQRSRAFYEGVLGLRFSEEDPFAIVMDANGIDIRIAKVRELNPPPYTILGWAVEEDIEDVVSKLRTKGVAFETYDFMTPGDNSIWTAPDGARVAWFKDPDGNTLSVSQDSN